MINQHFWPTWALFGCIPWAEDMLCGVSCWGILLLPGFNGICCGLPMLEGIWWDRVDGGSCAIDFPPPEDTCVCCLAASSACCAADSAAAGAGFCIDLPVYGLGTWSVEDTKQKVLQHKYELFWNRTDMGSGTSILLAVSYWLSLLNWGEHSHSTT